MCLEEEVLKRIKPTPEEEERILSVARELVERSCAIISELALNAEPIIVGSVAKGTFLRDPDIDIFIMFPPETPREDLEKLGLEIGKTLLPNGRENYAEHPYIKGEHRGFEVDVVPCYRVDSGSKKMSAVDRTPFHTEYVKNSLKDGQKDDVRLLKQFMKGVGVYGAEAEIEGFSGYLVELLILYYGSFREVLSGSGEWKRGTRLFLDKDSEKRFDAPLIFIDPVDPKRNVASALSVDSFALFIHAASEYLKNPDVRFFFPEKRAAEAYERILDEVKRKGTHILGFEMGRPDLVPDVLFPQIKKARRTISQRLNDSGFPVLNSAYSAMEDRLVFVFEVEVFRLPLVKNHYGPPVWSRNSGDFLKKWKNSPRRVEAGRWVVQIAREFWKASDYLKKAVEDSNLGKDLNGVKDTYTILTGGEIAKKYPLLLTELLFPVFPWEV